MTSTLTPHDPRRPAAHDSLYRAVSHTGLTRSITQNGLVAPDQPRERAKSLTDEEVIVFVEARDQLSLMRKDQLKENYASGVIKVPRWHNEQDIYLTDPAGEERYIATVKLNRLPRRQKVKRLLGSVNKLYVFDSTVPSSHVRT